jgi:chorismate mutase
MSDPLHDLRHLIDTVDERILILLSMRQLYVDAIAHVKAKTGQAVKDPGREAEILSRLTEKAGEYQIDPDFVEDLFEVIFHHSVDQQHAHELIDS